ncbi:chaperonin GroS [Burkholderia cenocepacia BC7]|nr:chaperonin GroS [Burkholderia cenocepacia K56-2Valvano]ERI26280.1 chaperonin GroS [Burkholderia cenocepacia BC7]
MLVQIRYWIAPPPIFILVSTLCQRVPANFDRTVQDEKMSLRPLHDRVIVKRLDQETTTASGIVIPDSAAEKPDQGEVIAVGPGRKDTDGQRIVPDLQVGERVLFGKYAGQAVKVDGNEFLVLREEDIVAVVNQ